VGGRFGSDPTIVGRTIQLSGRPHEVIGVMPAGFQYPDDATRWLPLAPVGPYKQVIGRAAISPHDPQTFVALPAGLMAVAVHASWIPARRALAVEPMTALRSD
jgi:hypothetical protein